MLDNENQGFPQDEDTGDTLANQDMTNEQEARAEQTALEGLELEETVPEAAQPEQLPEEPKKKDTKKKLKDMTKFKYRTTATVFTVLVVAVVIVVNILFGALGSKVNTKIDLTHDRILDLSDQTIETVKNLQQDVYVYSVIPESNDTILMAVDTMLERYQNLSGHIKYEKVDTAKNPTFIQKYQNTGEQLSQFTIIFESGDKFKVVDINDAVNYSSQTQTIQSLSAEQKFTSAIQYVVSTENTTVAVVEGHGEITANAFSSILTDENYAVESVNLTSSDIGEDIDMLIIASPQMDYTADEIDKLDRYFDQGGKAQIFMDISDASLPKLEAYLQEWGVAFQPGFVVDTNRGNYMQNMTLLLPNIESTEYTQTIVDNNLMMFVPQARGIAISDVVGIEAEEILTTSSNSFIRTDPNIQSTEMADTDIKGPVTLSALLTKSLDDGGTAQMLVMGNTNFLSSSLLDQSAFANKDFYLNASSYMTDKEDLYIRPKNVAPPLLAITGQQALIFGGITLILIPLLFLAAGIVIWLRRRHL